MADIEKVIKGLEELEGFLFTEYGKASADETSVLYNKFLAVSDALELLKDQQKTIKALQLLVEWAEECDFGFDQFYDEYERYKDEIKDMKYIDGMIHVAKRTLENHRAFET